MSDVDAKKIVAQLKKNILKYIEILQDKANKAYFEYLKTINVTPDKTYKIIVRIQNEKGVFEDIPVEFACTPGVEVSFEGIVVKKVQIDFEMPQFLIGEGFILPQVVITTQTYNPWMGNFGLAWEGLTGDKKKFGFYPYESSIKRKSDIKKYFSENIVDALCDLLDTNQSPLIAKLRKDLSKLISGKAKQYWQYVSAYDSSKINTIEVPIRCDYNATNKTSYLSFRHYTIGNGEDWPLLSEIVLDIFDPISTATSYFNDKGEMLSEEDVVEKLQEIEYGKKKVEAKKDSKKAPDVGPWNPFSSPDSVKRDEFGFIMDAKRDDSEFGSKEIKSAREKVANAGIEQIKQLMKDEAKESMIDTQPQDISKWKTPTDWYNEFQNRRFKIVGNKNTLSFVEKGELNLLLGCDPPFTLKFARDQIRVQNQMVTTEVVKLMIKYYEKGFLRLA